MTLMQIAIIYGLGLVTATGHSVRTGRSFNYRQFSEVQTMSQPPKKKHAGGRPKKAITGLTVQNSPRDCMHRRRDCSGL